MSSFFADIGIVVQTVRFPYEKLASVIAMAVIC